MYPRKLPTDVKKAKYAIQWVVTERHHLDPFFPQPTGDRGQVIFEIVDDETMDTLAAYEGFPVRMPHWRFGMEYEQLRKSTAYGLHRIYEMVINNNPPFAYLLDTNSLTDHKMVMAHAYAHCDFFKNNMWFRNTNRNAINVFANHTEKVLCLIDEKGRDTVEAWIDTCLSVANCINWPQVGVDPIARRDDRCLLDSPKDEEAPRLKILVENEYMDSFINPLEVVEERRQRFLEEKEHERAVIETKTKFPARPEPDLMDFFIHHAPLEEWQREIISMVRTEAYYFAPQRLTKIMNEGWAVFWHSKIMTEGLLLTPGEIVQYADENSRVTERRPGEFQLYFVARTLWEDIEWRWNTHRHGARYEACDSAMIHGEWEYFVIFKNLYEAYGGERIPIEKKWREFLCFVRALKGGFYGIPATLYKQATIIKQWYRYCNLEDEFARVERLIKESADKALEAEKRRSRALVDKKPRDIEWATSEIRSANRSVIYRQHMQRIFFAFGRIREEFRSGKLVPEFFPIPDEFWSYAGRFDMKGPFETQQGRGKIFEVRRNFCDVTFFEEFLTEDLCRKLELFVSVFDPDGGGERIATRDPTIIKAVLLAQLANGGEPCIHVINGNFENRGELLLRHMDDGFPLDMDEAKRTLQAIFAIWTRPVYLEYKEIEGEAVHHEVGKRLSFDGKEFRDVVIERPNISIMDEKPKKHKKKKR